jgi:hypothetical protein
MFIIIDTLTALVVAARVFIGTTDVHWILIPLQRLMIEVLLSIGHLFTNAKTNSSVLKKQRAQLSTVVQDIISLPSNSVMEQYLRLLATALQSILVDHVSHGVKAAAALIIGGVKSILTMKVDEELLRGLSLAGTAALEVFQHSNAKDQIAALMKLSPHRPITQTMMTYAQLCEASMCLNKTKSNWLFMSTYANTLIKFIYSAAINLHKDPQTATEILVASIHGDRQVMGLFSLLKKATRKHPRYLSDTMNALLDGHSLASLLKSVAMEAVGELMECVENSANKCVAPLLAHLQNIGNEAANTARELSYELVDRVIGGLEEFKKWILQLQKGLSRTMKHLTGLVGAFDTLLYYMDMFLFDRNSVDKVKKLILDRINNIDLMKTSSLETVWNMLKELVMNKEILVNTIAGQAKMVYTILIVVKEMVQKVLKDIKGLYSSLFQNSTQLAVWSDMKTDINDLRSYANQLRNNITDSKSKSTFWSSMTNCFSTAKSIDGPALLQTVKTKFQNVLVLLSMTDSVSNKVNMNDSKPPGNTQWSYLQFPGGTVLEAGKSIGLFATMQIKSNSPLQHWRMTEEGYLLNAGTQLVLDIANAHKQEFS